MLVSEGSKQCGGGTDMEYKVRELADPCELLGDLILPPMTSWLGSRVVYSSSQTFAKHKLSACCIPFLSFPSLLFLFSSVLTSWPGFFQPHVSCDQLVIRSWSGPAVNVCLFLVIRPPLIKLDFHSEAPFTRPLGRPRHALLRSSTHIPSFFDTMYQSIFITTRNFQARPT